MSDDLTRAIAEALGCQPYPRRSVPKDGPLLYCRTHDGTQDQSEGWPCADVTNVAAALAPLIEARVREARAEQLEAEAFGIERTARALSAPEHEDRKVILHVVHRLRRHAEEVRRG